MEIHLTPDLQRKLIDVAAKTGRRIDDLVQEAVAGFVDELNGLRSMLEARYEEVKSGRVKTIDGEEVFTRLREKSQSRRDPG
jgi:predicted transcriptional regulator